jgi:hypothetical protein
VAEAVWEGREPLDVEFLDLATFTKVMVRRLRRRQEVIVHSQVMNPIIKEGIERVGFSKRRWSWICAYDDFFLKVPRVSDDLLLDLGAAEVRNLAKAEHDSLSILGSYSHAVILPMLFIEECGCLVFPRISGRDLYDLLVKERTRRKCHELIAPALGLMGEVHRRSAAAPPVGLREKVYSQHNMRQEKRSVRESPRCLSVFGFEVRNFRLCDENDGVRFFDPHEVYLGYPEDDVSRFVLSLLMIHWGRNWSCRLWRNFSLDAILDSYEREGGLRLEERRFAECFRLNVAMRERYAEAALEGLSRMKDVLGRTYRLLFFAQIKHWARANGI